MAFFALCLDVFCFIFKVQSVTKFVLCVRVTCDEEIDG